MPSLMKRLTETASYVISGVRPNTWFSPSQPLPPMAPGEVKGRAFDFQVSRNLDYRPRSTEPVGFAKLKGLYRGCDLLRAVVNHQLDLIEALPHEVRAKQVGNKPPKPGSAAVNVKKATELLRQPEPDYDWGQWIRRMMREVYVTDALTIYPRKTIGGDMYSIDLIDGATITPLIDQTGRRPAPPSPAYQQILKGIPAADFSLEELLYFPKNPRVDGLYGESKVEAIINYIETTIQRVQSQKAYFTAGNTTDGVFSGPETWTTDQIKVWQKYWDDLFSGNLDNRRHGWWVPAGTKWQEIKQPPLKDEFDEWLARVICFEFSTNPGPFIKQQNRSNQESQQQVAEEGGIATDMAFIKRVIDRLFLMIGWDDIEFVWTADREFDPVEAAKMDDINLKNGSAVINDVRDRRGEDPIEGGDIARLQAGTGWVTLEQSDNPPDPIALAQAKAPKIGDPNDPNAPAPKPGEPPPAGPKGKGKTPAAAPAKKPPLKKGASIEVTDRPAMDKALRATAPKVAKVLAGAGVSVGHQVMRALLTLGKADDPAGDDAAKKKAEAQQIANQVADALDLSALEPVGDAVEPALSTTAGDAAEAVIAKVGPDNAEQLTGQASLRTVAYARDRAAELVGKKWDGNQWVDNPNPKWAITDSTRTMLRKTIADTLEEGKGSTGVLEAIKSSYAFSPERAALITHTEIRRANSQGGVVGARGLAGRGVKLKKLWLVGQEPCPVCVENSLVNLFGGVDVDADFPSGDDAPPGHPNCYCTVSFRVIDDFDDS